MLYRDSRVDHIFRKITDDLDDHLVVMLDLFQRGSGLELKDRRVEFGSGTCKLGVGYQSGVECLVPCFWRSYGGLSSQSLSL
jgi:hypothetical protein